MRDANAMFRRCPAVRITAGEETFERRGVVRPLDRKDGALSEETLSAYGAQTVPLWLYLGDAEELCETESRDAKLAAQGAVYRVLFAQREDAPGGPWVRAVLEKEGGT